MKNKKGFTIMELIIVIGLLVVIAGLFSVNMIRVMNKNKEDEIKNVERELISAADAYITMNPSMTQELYEGFKYIEIKVKDLREAGLINRDLKDPETGVIIDDEKVVKVVLGENGELVFDYGSNFNSIGWNLKYEDINLVVDPSGSDWCETHTASDVILINSNGEIATDEERTNADIKVKNCDVKINRVGTYRISYQYRNPTTGSLSEKSRRVNVIASTGDVSSFDAEILSYDNGRKIPKGATNIPIRITETNRNGKSTSMEITEKGTGDYEVTGYDSRNSGSLTIRRKIANSDGTFPNPVTKNYTVVPTIVNLNANGGTLNTTSIEVEKDKTYGNLPTPTKSGYIFMGWFTSTTGGTKVTNSTVVTTYENHTLHAHWQESQVTYTVCHNYMDTKGQYTETYLTTYTGTYGTGVYPELKPKIGFASPKQQYIVLKESSSNIIWYEYSRNRYNVSVDLDGGTYNGDEIPKKMYYGEKLNLGVPTKDNMEFESWSTTSGKIDASNVFEMLNADAKITAKYSTKKVKVQLEYDSNYVNLSVGYSFEIPVGETYYFYVTPRHDYHVHNFVCYGAETYYDHCYYDTQRVSITPYEKSERESIYCILDMEPVPYMC